MIKSSSARHGFTIVELLIVIVVIGILAAITIVAYNGVTGHAKLATLQSDLNNAATQLGIDNVNNGVYPATTAAANNGAGLKASPGTTWQYTFTSATDSYCLTGTNNAVSYYVSNTNNAPQAGACPGDINGGGGGVVNGVTIQTITSATCPSTPTRAVDARDNHTYWVQKLADGKCWMLTNLAYAGGGTNTYSDTKTLTNGTSNATTYTVASYYVVPSTTNFTTEPTAPSTATNGIGQYGYLYNWCGAMGGQATAACANAGTPVANTTITICPSGWRLPTGDPSGSDGTGEQYALNVAINGGSVSTDVGLRTTWLGQYSGYWSGGFGLQGSYGYHWSSSQVGSTYAAGRSFTSTAVSGGGYDKSYGFGVRCVAN